MNSIEEHYRAATEKSAQLNKRAERVMPGGDTRTSTYYRPYPLTLKRGEGPFIWDVDGNKYIDLIGNYTSLVHGNAYPPIVEAVSKAVRDGSSWPARSEAQIELATLLCERVESVDRVRFCNSGTEETGGTQGVDGQAKEAHERPRADQAGGLPRSVKDHIAGTPGAGHQ